VFTLLKSYSEELCCCYIGICKVYLDIIYLHIYKYITTYVCRMKQCCIRTYSFINILTYNTYIHTYTHIYKIYTYVHIYIYVCVCICEYIYVCVNVRAHTHVYTHMHMYTRIKVYVCIYTK